MPETNNQPLPSFGLLEIRVALELVDLTNHATAIARSCLVEGRRTIRVRLSSNHLIVSRALHRADTVVIRFLVGLALTEFCLFWHSSRDGASVGRELRKLAGYEPGERAWGSGFASRLSICESLRSIDTLPIFGREPQPGPHELFAFEAAMRSPSDVTNWRAKNGGEETVKPLPPKPREVNKKSEPVSVAAAPVAAATFLQAFHEHARNPRFRSAA